MNAACSEPAPRLPKPIACLALSDAAPARALFTSLLAGLRLLSEPTVRNDLLSALWHTVRTHQHAPAYTTLSHKEFEVVLGHIGKCDCHSHHVERRMATTPSAMRLDGSTDDGGIREWSRLRAPSFCKRALGHSCKRKACRAHARPPRRLAHYAVTGVR